MEGWVRIHRKMLSWQWYDDMPTKCLFLHLLLISNYTQSEWHGITVERGQIVTSYKNLATQTGLSVQQTRLALDKLQRTKEITIKTTNKFSIITICNYDSYQDENFTNNKQNNKQRTNKQQTKNKQTTTTKEYNNIINKKNIKEKINKKEKEEKINENFKTLLLDAGVAEDVASEFIEIRKAKGALNTAIAFRVLTEEAQKAGWSLAQAVEKAVKMQWKTFRADYVGRDAEKKTLQELASLRLTQNETKQMQTKEVTHDLTPQEVQDMSDEEIKERRAGVTFEVVGKEDGDAYMIIGEYMRRFIGENATFADWRQFF